MSHQVPAGKPVYAYRTLDELKELADNVVRDLQVGMPDSGAIRTDILSESERLAYDLARAVRDYVKENAR